MDDLQSRWDNECQGALTFMERLMVTPAADRLPWATKMQEHYANRVRELLTKVPPGMQHRARFYKRLLLGFTGR